MLEHGSNWENIMVKEYIDAVDARKAASMQTPLDTGGVGIPIETNQPEMQDPFGGVNFDDAYGIPGATVAGLWGSTQGMQSPFEAANQQSTLAGRQAATAWRDEVDEYKNYNPDAWGWNISTRTELPDDAWGNEISKRKPKKPEDGFNSGVGSF